MRLKTGNSNFLFSAVQRFVSGKVIGMNPQHFDILIVGAGLAGIGTACQLSQRFPGKSLALLERRAAIGGTWDLFTYPGIRSDSDMFTYGYQFRPWHSSTVLAEGATIRQYIEETAREFGVDKKIRFGLKITQADWSNDDQLWTLTAQHETSGEIRHYSCEFLFMCSGYFNHDAGYLPAFPGEDQFRGVRVHPQHWPADLDYTDKTVVVIGSGATAVTLVPAMANQVRHITMLQRSPSYIVSIPATDSITDVLRKFLPDSAVFRFARQRNLWKMRALYLASKRWPTFTRGLILSLVKKQIGNEVDMKHFSPNYAPWDQRVCAVPDNDLFQVVKSGKADIVTDQIDTFTQTGIRLKSGQELQADIIVTATGLQVQMLGGMQLSINGQAQVLKNHLIYKGVLVQNIPNFAYVFGHANTPWTLKTDMAASYLCRLLEHMQTNDQTVFVARTNRKCETDTSILGQFSSGYIQRGNDTSPRQGKEYPWQITHHLGKDKKILLKDPIQDQWLKFS